MLEARELTPAGSGGLSVLSVSGPDALDRVAELCAVEPAELRPGMVRLCRPRLEGEIVDEALVLVLASDRVELHLHGSPPLVRRLLSSLGSEASSAQRACGPPGAETLALGSLEADAWNRLPDAPSLAGARILLDQARGALRAELERIASLPREDGERVLADLLVRSRRALPALAPTCVLLAGPVNAGKSTLFNLICGRERVIVDRAAGTTRDAIVERVALGGWPVDLVDTAGDREAEGLEERGRRLGRALWKDADLVLWLVPPGGEAGPEHGEGRLIELDSCIDRTGSGGAQGISVHADPDSALERVTRVFAQAFDLPAEAWSSGMPQLFERRQIEHLDARGIAGMADLLRDADQLH